MRLGIDFDNTLVSYEGLFFRVGQDLGLLSADAPHNKTDIRSWLVSQGRENDYIRLQGVVYGTGVQHASAYPGVRECLETLRDMGVSLFLISHKTRHALAGEPYDLHAAAHRWLSANGFSPDIFPKEHIFLETTRAAKLQRITELHCTHFVDDLPAVLTDPAFPLATQRLLFGLNHACDGIYCAFCSWADIQAYLLNVVCNG